MTTTMDEPAIGDQVERVLHRTPGTSISLKRIYEQLPNLTTLQVRGSLKHLLKRGRVIFNGSRNYPSYQSVMGLNPARLDAPMLPSATAKAHKATAGQASPRPGASVHWPAGLEIHQHKPSPYLPGGDYEGVDWSQSVQRPGCQDHLGVPSRRGDQLVAHRGPMGILGAVRRD